MLVAYYRTVTPPPPLFFSDHQSDYTNMTCLLSGRWYLYWLVSTSTGISEESFGDPLDYPCHQQHKIYTYLVKYLTKTKQFSSPGGSLMFPPETTGWQYIFLSKNRHFLSVTIIGQKLYSPCSWQNTLKSLGFQSLLEAQMSAWESKLGWTKLMRMTDVMQTPCVSCMPPMELYEAVSPFSCIQFGDAQVWLCEVSNLSSSDISDSVTGNRHRQTDCADCLSSCLFSCTINALVVRRQLARWMGSIRKMTW